MFLYCGMTFDLRFRTPFLLARVAVLLAAASATSFGWALEPEAVFARASPAVWVVKADLGGQKFSVGSGVALTPNLLVTACHVVAKAIVVDIQRDKTQRRVVSITRDPDSARDLCVLEIGPGPALPVVVIAPIGDVRVGQRVYAIGTPHGLELTLSEGLVSALRPRAEGQLPIIQTSAALSSGSSGGGLFDAEARLIGVNDYVSPGGENLGFAYPAQWVTELPQRIAAELKRWRELLAAAGVKIGADGQPLASGHAPLADMQALPKLGNDPKPLQLAYQQFLLQARPRAFMITQDGHFGAVAGYDALVGQMKRCADTKTVCAVYAVDDTVVWGQQAGAK